MGRPKGARNKTTVLAKDAIEGAFAANGGQRWLNEWAAKNEDVFFGSLFPKLLPVQLNHADADGEKLQPSLNVFEAAASAIGLAASPEADDCVPGRVN